MQLFLQNDKRMTANAYRCAHLAIAERKGWKNGDRRTEHSRSRATMVLTSIRDSLCAERVELSFLCSRRETFRVSVQHFSINVSQRDGANTRKGVQGSKRQPIVAREAESKPCGD